MLRLSQTKNKQIYKQIPSNKVDDVLANKQYNVSVDLDLLSACKCKQTLKWFLSDGNVFWHNSRKSPKKCVYYLCMKRKLIMNMSH